MTTPSPAQQMASEISSLQSQIGDLQEKGPSGPNDARDSVEDLQTTLDGMPQRIASLRTKGYVFGRGTWRTRRRPLPDPGRSSCRDCWRS